MSAFPEHRRLFEATLSRILPPDIAKNIRSSTHLQAYATLIEMQKKLSAKPSDYIAAYKVVLEKTALYHLAVLPRMLVQAEGFYDTYLAFTTVSVDDFLRYIVPDLVCEPVAFLRYWRSKFGDDILLLAQRVIQTRLLMYTDFSVGRNSETTKINDADSYEDAVNKLYLAYEAQEKNPKILLSRSVFLEFYKAINLHPLNFSELTFQDSSSKNIDAAVDILTNQLGLSRADRIKTLYDFFVEGKQAGAIISQQQLYPFMGSQDLNERKKLMQKALIFSAKAYP